LATVAEPGFRQRLQQAWLTRGVLAWSMRPLALAFGAATALRRYLYLARLRRPEVLRAPVIVVGNLVAGGAGKTPSVIAITAALRRHGYTPGIVSRGYGGSHTGVVEVNRDVAASLCGDEPLLMFLRTSAPLVVGRDRVAAARHLLHGHPEVDVVIADDGLQHLALGRTVQVIVFDERGIGNGWLLPAGPLREPLARAVPARTLVAYNADTPSTPWPGTLAKRSLSGAVSLAGWWRGDAATPQALDALRGRPLLAAAGVARPQRFFRMLREQGLQIDPLPLPDHHDYRTLPWPADAGDAVVTEKDAIKLDPRRIGATRVWVAPLDFAFDAAFESALLALLPPPGTRHGNTPA
jgi:tetraacyldisaccharide 4'-kinase